MFEGYWLDDYTFIAPAVDKDKTIKWVKITTVLPRDHAGHITCDHLTGKFFDLEIIDPDNFYWKGQHLKIKVE